ncbi:hypothetical protein CBR_g58777 [Chara braunii]|uniref:Reverse transcriptase domain-containing protein n=1 Tax=Chara braunii TaxID=69332 RepID=A0A388MF33_CHABU|nr:hypothetical protein CBR_g58777 [Chara braunii]|eukprot:GBG93092.1 hypothetical protein CBR_g58777 [Chara braunii]
MSRESGTSGSGGLAGSAGGSGASGSGNEGFRQNSENWMAGRTCEKKHRDEYHDAKRRGVPFILPPQVQGGRNMATGHERRSLSADTSMRRSGGDTDGLMREYFLQKAQERRERLEREVREEAAWKDEAMRREAETKRLEELAEKRKYEDERDARLMWMINEIRSEGGAGAGSSTTTMEPVGKISLSLKHVTAGAGPGAREKYEEECRELFEALTIEELKDACKAEHVVYGKRELAINRLVKRRVTKVYDPINVPLSRLLGWSDARHVTLRRIRTRPSRQCKRMFEKEGWLILRDIMEASPRTLRMKQDLIWMFKNWRKQRELMAKSVDELVGYYGAAKLFLEKRSRTRARRMLSDVFKKRFGMNVRRRIIVKVEFDDRIRKGEVVRLVRSGVGKLRLTKPVMEMVRRRAPVVWTRKHNVGEILHNHRRYAADGVFGCICTDMPFLRVDGHVQFRIGELTDCPSIVLNAKNVPRDRSHGVVSRLAGELSNGMQDLSWLGNGIGKVTFSLVEVEGCVGGENGANSDVSEVRQLVDRLDRLNFDRLGKWDAEGRLGNAYALPRHKDTGKYRPICPTYSEPSNGVCRKIARAVNKLLFSLPESGHFNLKSICELRPRLTGINQKMRRVGEHTNLLVGLYDIKDMFSKLPHDTIMHTLEWCLWWQERRGFRGVWVKHRGKGVVLSQKALVEGFQFVEFAMIHDFVQFELNECFTVAGGTILRQVIGIPMGKATSPPLACLMCVKAEWDFLISLGNDRRLIVGIRYVDDASAFVAYDSRKQESRRKAERILASFEGCYDKALTLKRTEVSENEWEFLGCRLTVKDGFLYLGCCQAMKNEKDLLAGSELTFRGFQDYRSWTSKKAKLAVVVSALHRIERNSMANMQLVEALLLLRMELRRCNSPGHIFGKGLHNFARDKGMV